MTDFAIIMSLALTGPFLCYCIEILILWWPTVKNAYSTAAFGEATSALARGVFAGFLSNFLDNLYWGVTWFLVLTQQPFGTVMMFGGAVVNIFLRQIGGVYAAHEHIRAASAMFQHGEVRNIQIRKRVYWALSLLSFASLLLWRYM